MIKIEFKFPKLKGILTVKTLKEAIAFIDRIRKNKSGDAIITDFTEH